MSRRWAIGIVVLAMLGIAAWLVVRRGGDGEAVVATGSAATSAALPKAPAPKQPAAAAATPAATGPIEWSLDADVPGPLRLEGQVVDLDGTGVGEATVVLASNPPRTATTESDGSFAFDKLVGRTYALAAHRGDSIGGPVNYKVAAGADPIVIRIGEGAAIDVTVLDDARTPIAGATVKLRDLTSRTRDTDTAGLAKLAPISPGWVAVEVTAPGYASNGGVTTVGSAGARAALEVTLHRGFAVSGKVIDEHGAAIAHARVQAGLDDPWGQAPRDADGATTDNDGNFAIAALTPGDHTLSVNDGRHEPTAKRLHVVAPAMPNVTITMRDGGTIAGHVVDAARVPQANVTVRVASAGRQPWKVPPRTATTDAQGAFEVHGLPRAVNNVRAQSDAAASALATVDLGEAADKRDVELVLDVTGAISGIVVDETGTAVAEVPVNAFPDVLGGANPAAVAGGLASTTSGGDGRFTLRGLPDGDYRVWATRTTVEGQGQGPRTSTPGRVGQTNVKIVLPSPGGLKGTLAIDGAGKPSLATIQLGYGAPTPTTTGAFAIRDVAPGTYDVTVHGLEFEELLARDVKIEPGKVTDLGSVKLVHGRTLTGKVVDGSGRAVAGARVKVGEQIFAAQGDDGGQLDQWDQLTNTRTATTDADGAFAIAGVPRKPTIVGADHPSGGRSLAQAVPPGDGDPPAVTLVVKSFGSVSGIVTKKGKPVAGAQIDESTVGGTGMATFAETAEDGTFELPRVAEGAHAIRATERKTMASRSASSTVTVVAGKAQRVTIEIPVGDVALEVAIKPTAGARIDSAQVFLFPKEFAPKTGGELMAGATGALMKFWYGADKPLPQFDELLPGSYSVCSIPITGDMNDPTFMQRVQENVATLRVYCKPVAVTPGPAKQLATQELPAMSPLPS